MRAWRSAPPGHANILTVIGDFYFNRVTVQQGGLNTHASQRLSVPLISDLMYRQYPQRSVSLGEFIASARREGVDYLVFSDIERDYFGDSEVMRILGTIKGMGIQKIYSVPSVTIYELARGPGE